jgi:rhodanese-related sulfurtransferase
MRIPRITPAVAKARLDRGEPLLFVDARNPTAWGTSNIRLPGAIRVPADQVDGLAAELPRGRPIVAYCT